MVFGTNTVLGISAGKDVDTPSVTVGYKRQELVLMPLVANETENNRHELVPCKLSDHADESDHPCLLVAVRGDGKNKVAKDSYSVLASFGANFDGGVDTKVSVKGGLAQYFATGMAAQLLALSGGAAVVATGTAAQASAAVKPDASAVAAVIGDPELAAALTDPKIKEKARVEALMNQNAAGLAAQYLSTIPDSDFSAEIGMLDEAAGLDGNLVFACKGRTSAECIAQINNTFAGRDPTKIIQAVLLRAQSKGKKL